jgi:aldehyde dehydrogenase (NAD+)
MLVSMGPVLTNAGQVCSATARVLMEASVYDDLVDRIVTLAGQCTPGVPKLPQHV